MKKLLKPNQNEMCPPGFHIVKAHKRICRSGSASWVDSHVRKNRRWTKLDLLIENISYLYWNSATKFEQLPKISEFPSENEYDSLIQFWLAYWKSQGLKFPTDLDPLMIKALISVESSFDPNARTNDPRSTASGLMQITDQSLRILAGNPNKDGWTEIQNNRIFVKKDDRFNPVVSVAMGTRLLAHKFTQIPKKYPKNARSLIIGYHQWNKKGEAYADKILLCAEKARKNN